MNIEHPIPLKLLWLITCILLEEDKTGEVLYCTNDKMKYLHVM